VTRKLVHGRYALEILEADIVKCCAAELEAQGMTVQREWAHEMGRVDILAQNDKRGLPSARPHASTRGEGFLLVEVKARWYAQHIAHAVGQLLLAREAVARDRRYRHNSVSMAIAGPGAPPMRARVLLRALDIDCMVINVDHLVSKGSARRERGMRAAVDALGAALKVGQACP